MHIGASARDSESVESGVTVPSLLRLRARLESDRREIPGVHRAPLALSCPRGPAAHPAGAPLWHLPCWLASGKADSEACESLASGKEGQATAARPPGRLSCQSL